MTAPATRPLLRAGLLWPLRSPTLLLALLAGTLTTLVLARAVGAIREARRIREAMELAAAGLAAEAAAVAFVETGGCRSRNAVDAGGGIRVDTAVAGSGANALAMLEASVGDHRCRFAFPLLAGGAHGAFGTPFAMAAGGLGLPPGWPAPRLLAADGLPVLAAAEPLECTSHPLLFRDAGIALLRLRAGTDRDDFVFGRNGTDPQAVPVPAQGVLHVEGNFWVDAGEGPLHLQLPSDLTIVVDGNAYLGRSIHIRGPGHLLIVTLSRRGVAFADADGNGRWSPTDRACAAGDFRGPAEGAGNVYCGLPGLATAAVELDAGLLVHGVLHAAADRIAIHGPTMLAGGGTVLPGCAGRLVTTGSRLPELLRAVVPGFDAVGGQRPGRLTVLPPDRQPLYLASPCR